MESIGIGISGILIYDIVLLKINVPFYSMAFHLAFYI